MTDRPYTDDDLHAEAARQLSHAADHLDADRVGQEMCGAPIASKSGLATGARWDDEQVTEAEFAEAESKIYALMKGAADVSEWAINLGADGLEPGGHTLQLGARDGADGEDAPQIRMHFAFAPDLPDDDRDRFVMELSKVIARNL